MQDTFISTRRRCRQTETRPLFVADHTSPVQVHDDEAEARRFASSPSAAASAGTNLTPHIARHSIQVEGLHVDARHRRRPQGHRRILLPAIAPPRDESAFRPHFFPYTEPSFEIDLSTPHFRARGKEWIELGGCGMVDPTVFKASATPTTNNRLAFGFGIDRLAQIMWSINDIRLFTENDVRFLGAVLIPWESCLNGSLSTLSDLVIVTL